jgi:thiamine kinase-like enzyme
VFSNELKKLHSLKIKYSMIKHDYKEFIKLTNTVLPIKHMDKYINLVNKYKNLTLMLSHNDLSRDNLLWNKNQNKIHFIDYEWARINNQYWDIANFIRETSLKNKWIKYLANINKLDLKILEDFIYISINYAYQWTFAMPQTKKILMYRKKMLSKLNKYL